MEASLDEQDTPTFYASGLQVALSPWDITLRFSIREGDTPKDIRPVANVVLSPQHAWVLARLLRKQIDSYEQTVGKINLPPRLLNDLGVEE